MNWKAEAIERLRRLEAMQHALCNIPEELARLEAVVGNPRGTCTERVSVKSSGGQSDALLNNIVSRQELLWSLEQAQYWVKTTEDALSVLMPEERLILHTMYIAPHSDGLNRLCQRLQVEQSSIYRRRDKALRSFTVALYGTEGS